MDRPHRPRHRQRHEDLTGVRRGGAMEASRRGRGDDGPGPGAAGSVPVVDQAECTAQACRSCVAVTLADAIALGCCPCAVLSLLGLAFIKAPLAVARRCLRQMRRRRGELRHQKRVGDLDDPAVAKAKCRRRSRSDAGRGHGALEALDAEAVSKCAWGLEADARGEVARASSSSAAGSGRPDDDEKVWMEMYQVGQWGFGRLSISVTSPPPPVRPGRSPDSDGGGKDVDLRCES